jgi:hypothetical protein
MAQPGVVVRRADQSVSHSFVPSTATLLGEVRGGWVIRVGAALGLRFALLHGAAEDLQ